MTSTSTQRVQSYLKRIGAKRILMPFFFDDMIYIVLPLLVLLGFKFHTEGVSADFLSEKEWSFANVLLCGIAIKRMFNLTSNRAYLRKYENFTIGIFSVRTDCVIINTVFGDFGGEGKSSDLVRWPLAIPISCSNAYIFGWIRGSILYI